MKKILLTFACALSAMAMFSACDKGEDVKEFKDENATVEGLDNRGYPSVRTR